MINAVYSVDDYKTTRKAEPVSTREGWTINHPQKDVSIMPKKTHHNLQTSHAFLSASTEAFKCQHLFYFEAAFSVPLVVTIWPLLTL